MKGRLNRASHCRLQRGTTMEPMGAKKRKKKRGSRGDPVGLGKTVEDTSSKAEHGQLTSRICCTGDREEARRRREGRRECEEVVGRPG